MSVLYVYDNIYEIQNVIHSLFTVKLNNVTIKTWNIWLVTTYVYHAALTLNGASSCAQQAPRAQFS